MAKAKKKVKLITVNECFKEAYKNTETDRLLEMRSNYVGRKVLSNTMMESDILNQIISDIECELDRRNVSYE